MKEIYTVPTEAREDVFKAVKRLQKKAAAYGKTLIVEEGPAYAKERKIYERDSETNVHHVVDSELVEVFDLTVESDIIMKDGYTVVARIEHLEGGNVVHVFDGSAVHESWYSLLPNCEHCGHKRDRSVTFIVRGEDGNIKQIGRTCLKDYCGIDPQCVGIFNQIQDLFLDDYDYESYDLNEHSGSRAYAVQKVLAFSIRVLAAQGYRKSDEIGCNRDKVLGLMADNAYPTDEEMLEAGQLMKSISAIADCEDAGSMIENIKSIVNSRYCKQNHFGVLAYAPVACKRHYEWMERKAAKEVQKVSERQQSKWVGEIGERICFNVESCALVTSWENSFGYTYLYKFVTIDGASLVWFASHTLPGTGIKQIKATIKDHSERDGVKQTVITRCTAL